MGYAVCLILSGASDNGFELVCIETQLLILPWLQPGGGLVRIQSEPF